MNWGNTWRMPTIEDLLELLDGCIWEWTDNYDNSGVAGQIGTSKNNGNTIFLPATGYKDASNKVYDIEGHYWLSSLDNTYSNISCSFNFNSKKANKSYEKRYLGQNVRAVVR